MEKTKIRLIWVNAERQFEPALLDALIADSNFGNPRVVERDAHQAEIETSFDSQPNILEAIIDALLNLVGFDISIQGADREHLPTVVFRSVPLLGRQKPVRPPREKRHTDPATAIPSGRPVSSSERVLSTVEMAQASGPSVKQHADRRSHPSLDVEDDQRSTGSPRVPFTALGRHGSRVFPLVRRIGRILFTEIEPPDTASGGKQRMIETKPDQRRNAARRWSASRERTRETGS